MWCPARSGKSLAVVALLVAVTTIPSGMHPAAVTADRASDEALAAQLLPQPQHLEAKGFVLSLDDSWAIAVDVADPDLVFAATWFNEHVDTSAPLALDIVDGPAQYPAPRRLVIGDPVRHAHVRDALLRRNRTLPSAVGDEGYLLEAFEDAPAEIVIAAHTSHGAFYGVVTLLQLLDADAGLAGIRVVDYPEHGLRGTYETRSIRLDWSDGRYHFTDGNREFIDWLAARKYNTVFTVENGAFFREEDTWLEAYQALFAYARERHIEPVPRICSISTVSPFPFELYEGWPVAGERFTFDSRDVAVPDVPFVDLAPNGGFELDADRDGAPDGWTVPQIEGAQWAVDDTVAHSGERSMRLHIPVPAPDSNAAMLRITLPDVVDESFYCLWAKARAEDIVDVRPQLTMYVRNTAGDVTAAQSDVTWSTNGWKDFGTCLQAPADSATITLYSRIQTPGTGTFWLDDVRLLRVDGGLRNIIRTHDTDIRITDLPGGTVYAEGQDYAVTDGATSIKFTPELEPFEITRLPGGRIAPGQTVTVSYDTYLFYKASEYWRSAPCVARDDLYTDFYYPAIDAVTTHLKPEIINIDADEVRGFYRDSRMLARFGNNAEAIAYWANRIADYLAAADPEARLWIWDDMVSPYHNGGVETYQANYGGRPGRMAEATEKEWLDKSVLMDVWWYGDSRISQMWHSIEYFGRKGYEVLGSPWLEEENIVSWSEMLVDQPHSLGGVETNWGTPFEESHERFADHFWNTRYGLTLFDDFEIDADADGIPDGWLAVGAIDYSTDGTQGQGTRYAGFPNAAVGVTEDTAAFHSALLGVRPHTGYVLSAYAKRAKPGPEPRLILEWYDAGAGLIAQASAPLPDLGPEYTKHQVAAVSPPDAAYASVRLDASAHGVWYDVIRLKEETVFFGVIGPDALADAIVDMPVTVPLLAAGGVEPHTWSLAAGALPPGVTLDASSALAGTPELPGDHAITVRVTDAAGRTDTKDYAWNVLPLAVMDQAHVPLAQKGWPTLR